MPNIIAWTEKASRRCRARSISARSWCGCATSLPADAIITNGAGNFSGWMHRFYRFRRSARIIGPTSGSMGYGVPAAVAMKRLYPERTVVCVAGDGDFLMTGRNSRPPCSTNCRSSCIVVDNGMYGTIRMHQEREYPGRVVGDAAAQSGFRRLRAGVRRLRR